MSAILGASRVGFDVVVTLSLDLLPAHVLESHGQAAVAAVRATLERVPGVAQVRVRWRGRQPGSSEPPLVTVHPIGSAAPATGASWDALRNLCAGLVLEALNATAARQGGCRSGGAV